MMLMPASCYSGPASTTACGLSRLADRQQCVRPPPLWPPLGGGTSLMVASRFARNGTKVWSRAGWCWLNYWL